ncbi:hypothetical protein AVEN_69060-1 [Araneus ventricosus]|uniref:Uncharacterized protein n=1 Tax=Araneus ventricosus TaxID=182803 RepID=A0A4Y2KBZ4_ARAVE|nr:hypothetical protein AVEN_69060-1 [Araneus ventricosus]
MPRRETHLLTMTFPPPCFLLKSSTWGRNECLGDDESTVSHQSKQHVYAFITPKDIFPLSWSSPCAPSPIPPAPCDYS